MADLLGLHATAAQGSARSIKELSRKLGKET